MKKLKHILLIDDSEADNFYHERVLTMNECADKITAINSGEKALDFLIQLWKDGYNQPELIFLDINMPKMNGFEFLEAFERAGNDLRDDTIVYMLTTSENPADEQKSKAFLDVTGYINKPLKIEDIEKVIGNHF